jgi:CTP-dependent riboflavin kinase
MGVDRANLMKNARISRKTYQKCIKELREYGYIKYEASNSPFSRSRVLLKRL